MLNGWLYLVSSLSLDTGLDLDLDLDLDLAGSLAAAVHDLAAAVRDPDMVNSLGVAVRDLDLVGTLAAAVHDLVAAVRDRDHVGKGQTLLLGLLI